MMVCCHVVALIIGLIASGAQDGALRDRVGQLVSEISSGATEARAEAESRLIELGPRVLPMLPVEFEAGADEESRERLARVRAKLEEAGEVLSAEASRVTIQGQGVRFVDALGQLQRQSGNPISDLREAYGGELTNPALDLDYVDAPFFEVLEGIAEKAGVGLSFYNADGTIGIVPAGMEMGYEAGSEGGARSKAPVERVGPYRLALQRLVITSDLRTGGSRASAEFELAWEPRLRPMLLALKAEGLTIEDDQGRKVAPEVEGESLSTVLRPENPAASINLAMEAPKRDARSLKELTVRGEVTLPAGVKRFRFATLEKDDQSQKQGDVTVTLESTEVDDNVWMVNLRLEMPAGGGALESYQQGLFNNRIWLQKSDGTRFEHNGGYSTTASGAGMIGFEYLFVDAPGKIGDWQLYYETPSRVAVVPVEFTFKELALP